MLRLVNERPRSRWSQLGHSGMAKKSSYYCPLRLVMNQLTIGDNLSARQLDFSSVVRTSYGSIASCEDLPEIALKKKKR